jgi:uncharacterized membrane protein
MKKLQYALMAIVFLIAGLSAMMWYGEGFDRWSWQICTMMWVADSFLKSKQIDKLEK